MLWGQRQLCQQPLQGRLTARGHLQGRLRNDTPGPGYLHLGQAATDQFLAELFPWKRRAKMVKGFTRYEWHLPAGEHDEGGDCTRMAYAALQLVARRYNRASMWDQLEASAGRAPAQGGSGTSRFASGGLYDG